MLCVLIVDQIQYTVFLCSMSQSADLCLYNFPFDSSSTSLKETPRRHLNLLHKMQAKKQHKNTLWSCSMSEEKVREIATFGSIADDNMMCNEEANQYCAEADDIISLTFESESTHDTLMYGEMLRPPPNFAQIYALDWRRSFVEPDWRVLLNMIYEVRWSMVHPFATLGLPIMQHMLLYADIRSLINLTCVDTWCYQLHGGDIQSLRKALSLDMGDREESLTF